MEFVKTIESLSINVESFYFLLDTVGVDPGQDALNVRQCHESLLDLSSQVLVFAQLFYRVKSVADLSSVSQRANNPSLEHSLAKRCTTTFPQEAEQ